jgi:transcription-repair coupling factor (superfamily II helicase)
LSDLFSSLKNHPAISPLLEKTGCFQVDDTLGIALLVATAFHTKPHRICVVATNIYNAQRIYDLLSSFIGEGNCLLFPADELLRAESLAASKEMMAQRLYVMHRLLQKEDNILITHAAAVMRLVPDPNYFAQQSLVFKKGNKYDLNKLKEALTANGYTRVSKVDQSLQFASRGDIIDIYSVNLDNPVRLEFFDDELESIRFFDGATQASTNEIDEVNILPASDFLLTEDELERAITNIENRLKEDEQHLSQLIFNRLANNVSQDLTLLQERIYNHRLYRYLKLIQSQYFSILDYTKNATILVANYDQTIAVNKLLLEESFEYFNELHLQGQILSGLAMYRDLLRIFSERKNVLIAQEFVTTANFIPFNVRPIINVGHSPKQIGELINNYLSRADKIVLAISSPQQMSTVSDVLKAKKIQYQQVEGMNLPKGKIGITQMALESGFELVDQGIVYISENELFGLRHRPSKFVNRFFEAHIIKTYEELNPGDYVVHETSGVGQFVGIKTMEIDNVHRDYIQIAYAGKDVLYVPLSQFKLVRRYVGKEGITPRLNRLNSNEWAKTKKKIKERVDDLAERLLQLYSKRTQVKGFAFAKDDELQKEFEQQFQFQLTTDQLNSLNEIKKDMEKSEPMDRLLCGDVGFGKTEVAFRAAFKAISNGKQVAILCPTTLLARQHYEVAVERFVSYGINIAIFSRLITETKQRKFIEGIKNGDIHLAIGTHRILSNDIKFNDLGLLIIDEEQRFGVEQKEKIKELKTNIDVLTLTATPIPRTLQISLLGIRQISQLNTPPTSRMPIQTYVIPHNEAIIKELIERELGRQGQVFYLHNQVSTIDAVARKYQRLVKQAKIGVVHGQMMRDDIEDVMIKFYSGELNLLICTTIIENGIDIANANLIIIEEAQNFGLAQLYQIKGRVGRGNRIAYAYLLFREHKMMSEKATKRLKAIQDFTELGSGYRIAQRDLMIRGAGDILGPEQAGFIDRVGIDMYIKLLNEAIIEKKTGLPSKTLEMVPSLTIDAYIPEKYAHSSEKIELYHEIENAKTTVELSDIEKYIRDVYGKMPQEVILLLKKRQIDIYLENEAIESLKETRQYIDVLLSKKFIELNKSGTLLFDKTQLLLPVIKVFYVNKELKIRLFKKGQWLENLSKLLNDIVEVYDSLLKIKT